MRKILIKTDYIKIVIDIFRQQPEDLLPFYLNLLEDYYYYNRDMLLKISNEVYLYYSIYTELNLLGETGEINRNIYYKPSLDSAIMVADNETENIGIYSICWEVLENVPKRISLPYLATETPDFIEDYFDFHFQTIAIAHIYINLNKYLKELTQSKKNINKLELEDCFYFMPEDLKNKYRLLNSEKGTKLDSEESFFLFTMQNNICKEYFIKNRWATYLINNLNEVTINNNSLEITNQLTMELYLYIACSTTINNIEINGVPSTIIRSSLLHEKLKATKLLFNLDNNTFKIFSTTLFFIIPYILRNEDNGPLSEIKNRIINDPTLTDYLTYIENNYTEIIIPHLSNGIEISELDFLQDEINYCNKLLIKTNNYDDLNDLIVIQKTIKSYLDYLTTKFKSHGTEKSNLTGFDTKLDVETLKKCHKIMKNQLQVDETTFIKLFSGQEFSLKKKIEWKVYWGGRPNQKALTVFLRLMFSRNEDLVSLLKKNQGEILTKEIFSKGINRSNYKSKSSYGSRWYQELSNLLQN